MLCKNKNKKETIKKVGNNADIIDVEMNDMDYY